MGSRYRVLNTNHWLGQPATAQNVVPATVGLANAAVRPKQVYLFNGSAGNVAQALVGFYPDSLWVAGQWVNSTTTYTADTTDAQDADTNDCALMTTTINDGHVLGCTYPFGVVSYDITTASVGAAGTGVWEYWNGAWTALVAAQMLVDIPGRSAGVQWALGELLVMFDPPLDWAKGGSGTDVPQDKYNCRYRASAAYTTAALARRIYLGIPITSWGLVATKVETNRQYPEESQGIEVPPGVAYLSCAQNLPLGTVSTVVGGMLELIF